GKTGVLETHGLVVLRPFLTDNGVLKSCFFKSRLPVIDTGDEIGPPFFWCGRVDVINDLFFGFHQLASFPFFDVFVLWFQAPVMDETRGLDSLLVIAVYGVLAGEETYAGIEEPFA